MAERRAGFFRRLDRGINHFEHWMLALGILLMSSLTIINVFARNVLGNSLSFVDEINQVLIILITFMGVGYAARQGRHIRMTAIYDQLPAPWRKGLMIAIAAITALLLFALSYYAAIYVLNTRGVGSVTPALRIPLYLVYVVVPVGLGLGGVQYLLTVVRNLISPGVWISFDHTDGYAQVDEEEEAHI